MWDVVIVGAGILGLATARELLRRSPDARLLVLEREASIAAGSGCAGRGLGRGVIAGSSASDADKGSRGSTR